MKNFKLFKQIPVDIISHQFLKDNKQINIVSTNILSIDEEPVKKYDLEPFWHVYSIDTKCTVVGKKIVTGVRARVAYRCSKTKEIKSIERRLIPHHLVVYFESLDDLYYYDFSALRYKERCLTNLTNYFSKININTANYFEKLYY
jgi:hypothetical protein